MKASIFIITIVILILFGSIASGKTADIGIILNITQITNVTNVTNIEGGGDPRIGAPPYLYNDSTSIFWNSTYGNFTYYERELANATFQYKIIDNCSTDEYAFGIWLNGSMMCWMLPVNTDNPRYGTPPFLYNDSTNITFNTSEANATWYTRDLANETFQLKDNGTFSSVIGNQGNFTQIGFSSMYGNDIVLISVNGTSGSYAYINMTMYNATNGTMGTANILDKINMKQDVGDKIALYPDLTNYFGTAVTYEDVASYRIYIGSAAGGKFSVYKRGAATTSVFNWSASNQVESSSKVNFKNGLASVEANFSSMGANFGNFTLGYVNIINSTAGSFNHVNVTNANITNVFSENVTTGNLEIGDENLTMRIYPSATGQYIVWAVDAV